MLSPILSELSHIMTIPLFWVIVALIFAVWQFIRNKLRMDIIALLVITFFCLSQILTVPEALSGLSDPNVVLIALLFVIGEGLVYTGVAYQVSNWLMKVSGKNELKVLIFLMLSIAGLGSFMSSTGIVAIFIPVVLSICSSMNISPKRLMMPLSMAGLISGMMTLIATPPNLVAHSELKKSGFDGFDFFSFTPIGILILIAGIIYMIFARRWLDSNENDKNHIHKQSSMKQLIEEYRLDGRAKMVLITPESNLVGKNINELNLRSVHRLNIIAIQRFKHFRHITLSAFGTLQLQVKDILLLDADTSEEEFEQICYHFKLKQVALKGEYFSAHARAIGMAELSLIPETNSIGKTLLELGLNTNYGLSVVGLKRDNQIYHQNIIHEPLKSGDILLVIGVWQQILNMDKKYEDFFLLRTPEESKQVAPAISQAPHALFSVVVMVGLMISGIVPNVMAALIACLMMGKFRCINMQRAYNSIHFPSIILIVGMMPFSIAMQKTGGIDLIVDLLLNFVGDLDFHAILVILFIITAIVGAFISNTATAILVMPIAIAVAKQLNYSPLPFAMVVAIASSAAFMTPVSSPVNTMVISPAGYRFIDFIKIGVPFTLIVMIISVFAIPFFFPL